MSIGNNQFPYNFDESPNFRYNRCMFDFDISILRALYLKSHGHFRQYDGFNSRDVPDRPYVIFQTQAVENYELY